MTKASYKSYGVYYTQSIGESLQKLSIFRKPISTVSVLRTNWVEIVPNSMADMAVQRFTKGVLTVSSPVPVIYIQHFADEIKIRCNNFIGSESINKIVFIPKY